MPKRGYVYILSSRRNGTLYTGVTSNLVRRVYYETHEDIRDATRREKRIKKWNRQWKLELIEKANPDWCDLYDELEANPGLLA